MRFVYLKMSETTITKYEEYKEHVGGFFEAASNANCVPKNLAEFWAQLLFILEIILEKPVDELSTQEMELELYCRKPWLYWSSWTSSSLEKPPHQTYPIETFIAKLEELVKHIEEDNARKTTRVFKLETYFYLFSFLVLLCAGVAYYLL